MATSSVVNDISSGITMMSLDEFLQGSPPKPAMDVFQQFPLERSDRCTNDEQIRYPIDPFGSGTGHGGRPPLRPRKDGVRPGVLLTPDPPKIQPLRPKAKSSLTGMESVLTIGSQEAKSMKEGVAASHDLEVDLEAVLTNGIPQKEMNFVLGQRVDFEAGQTSHFLPVKSVGQLRRNTILKLLVGFLNAGEKGTIYMGINENGSVEGVTAEPHLITQVIEGLMKTIKFYLMPVLHTPQYGVRYTNVVTTSGQQLNNLWVIELHAVPEMQHYYNPIMDMNYYIRHGKETKTLPFTNFCDAVVAHKSEACEKDIQKLENRIDHLRQALEAKGIDTSAAVPHLCENCWLNNCPNQCYGDIVTKESNNGV